MSDLHGRTLALAWDRGHRGCTFATNDEASTPGYDEAYVLGREYRNGRVMEPHTLMACGCPSCRLGRIARQHAPVLS